jgi:hypothetical protein
VRTIEASKGLAFALGTQGYHFNGQEPEASALQYDGFVNTPGSVMVATNALSTGLDVSSIRFSISVGQPDSIALLIQEMGRAGRDGLATQALLIRVMGHLPGKSDQISPVLASDFAGVLALQALLTSNSCIRAHLTDWTDGRSSPCASTTPETAVCSRCADVRPFKPLARVWPLPLGGTPAQVHLSHDRPNKSADVP